METGMQRAFVLRDLRASVTFPKDFDFATFNDQSQIIKMLLDDVPTNRPSCEDLIKSPLLPVMLEEQFVNEAMKSLTSPSSYPLLVSSLFNRPTDLHKDFSYDFNSNANLDPTYCLLMTRMQAHAMKVFDRHGSIQISSPLFMPKNDSVFHPTGSKRPVQVLDESGDIVQLPWDLTVPFARHISRSVQHNPNWHSLKRFSMDNVYRKNVVGGQPKSIMECDFDIVTRAASTTMMAEAEGNTFLAWDRQEHSLFQS